MALLGLITVVVLLAVIAGADVFDAFRCAMFFHSKNPPALASAKAKSSSALTRPPRVQG